MGIQSELPRCPGDDNSRMDPSGHLLAKLKPVCGAMRHHGRAEASTDAPCLVWGTALTHSGSVDEVWELPSAPVQNGLLDPFHVQEQSGLHGSGGGRRPAQTEIISPREGAQTEAWELACKQGQCPKLAPGCCQGHSCSLAFCPLHPLLLT